MSMTSAQASRPLSEAAGNGHAAVPTPTHARAVYSNLRATSGYARFSSDEISKSWRRLLQLRLFCLRIVIHSTLRQITRNKMVNHYHFSVQYLEIFLIGRPTLVVMQRASMRFPTHCATVLV